MRQAPFQPHGRLAAVQTQFADHVRLSAQIGRKEPNRRCRVDLLSGSEEPMEI
jgi:hypothetical protein